VVYRSKYHIALEQLRRALSNGARFGWVTADEWYSEKRRFVEGLEQMKLRFVLEIPKNMMGWLHEPTGVGQGRGDVQTLCRYSRPMMRQPWMPYHIKDTDKGPMVWEAKAAPFWMRRHGQVAGPYWLIVARDVLRPDEVKYFLSNAAPGTPIEPILHVAFSRWPIERCLEEEKTELGLSHFECRQYGAVLRHLLITQVSHLFLARECQRLRGEKSRDHGLPDSHGQRCVDRHVGLGQGGPAATDRSCGRGFDANSTAQCRGEEVTHQGPPQTLEETGDASRANEIPYPAVTAIAL
jgi:hypothetical protein